MKGERTFGCDFPYGAGGKRSGRTTGEALLIQLSTLLCKTNACRFGCTYCNDVLLIFSSVTVFVKSRCYLLGKGIGVFCESNNDEVNSFIILSKFNIHLNKIDET